MTARTRMVLLVIASLALATAVVAVIVGRSQGSDSAAIVQDLDVQGPSSPFKGAVRPITRPIDFALKDQEGKVVQLAALRGKVVVLSPMYTTCRDTCPLTAQQIRGALDDLSGGERDQVRALALSVDPANDTADSARRFLVERRVSGYLDFLLGPRDQLAPVWKAYGFAPQTAAHEHNSYVVVIDRRGRQRVGFPVDYLTPEDLAHDIRVLLRQPA